MNEADDLEDFRKDVGDWLSQNFPSSLLTENAAEDGTRTSADAAAWKNALCEKGWGTPTWPKEYGGGGLSRSEARILREEMRQIGAWNPIGWGMGVRMLGPTLMEFGNEEQKRKHIPLICRGESQWCQGYSEPGAGSDLASLQTRAEDRGDHFLVNGHKIWTSGANMATWCFCLVRTDPEHKHDGISFVLIDMTLPGIEVRPITLISGSSPFCEVFLTDVKVPKENLVGKLNKGWTIGKRLLQFERQTDENAGGPRGGKRKIRRIEDIAASYIGVDDQGRLADPAIREKLTRHMMDKAALKATMKRIAAARQSGGPDLTSSIVKNVSSVLGQEKMELLIEIMGSSALGWEGDAFTEEELAVVRDWLGGKATTIYAGSYEIQNNIIAKRILGLPDATSS